MIGIVFLKELLADRLILPFGFMFSLHDHQNPVNIGAHNEANQQMLLVKDVPDYFTLHNTNPGNSLRNSKLRTLEGYYVELSEFEGYHHYLNRKISAKRRSNLRKYQKRLELCLDIQYTIYYGSIDRQEYHNLFKSLRGFLTRRFTEKKEVNYEMPHLQEMEEIVYDLILKKKASLFVIYHDKRPISVRINMFFQELAYYIISGYDIDYSAFHIGLIDMLKNIEWCFQAGFTRYDLLKGYPSYKRQWTTHRYYNYDHLIYNRGNILQLGKKALMFSTVNLRYRLLELSRQSGVYHSLKKIKRSFYGIRFKAPSAKYRWTAPDTSIPGAGEIHVFEDPKYYSLHRPVYDYLFQHKERLEDIAVYTYKSQSNRYLIKGKNTSKVLLIK